jgi:hypothetical protein
MRAEGNSSRGHQLHCAHTFSYLIRLRSLILNCLRSLERWDGQNLPLPEAYCGIKFYRLRMYKIHIVTCRANLKFLDKCKTNLIFRCYLWAS